MLHWSYCDLTFVRSALPRVDPLLLHCLHFDAECLTLETESEVVNSIHHTQFTGI